ncbi:MAG: hypothetical protein AB4290_14535, partial [Spirulina sp.]
MSPTLPLLTLNPPSPFLKWQETIDWAKQHYRDRSFNKDETIPTRPGLIYLLQYGAVALKVKAKELSLIH